MPPDPIASGTLDKTPFAHVLMYLEQRQLSGTLAVWPDAAEEGDAQSQDRVLFLKGRPVAGRLVEPAPSLREGLLRLFARARAPYAFYEGNLVGDDRISGRVDPLALIAESLRSVARNDALDAVVDSVLERLGDAKLRIQPNVDLKRYAFDRSERCLVELLQADPTGAASLVVASGVPEARARRIVYLLAITKAVAPYDERARATGPVDARAPGPVSDAAPAPTAAPAPAPAASAAPAPAAAPVAAPAPASPVPAPAPLRPGQPSIPPPSALTSGQLHGRLDRMAAVPPMPDKLSPELRDRWQRIVAKSRLVENQNYFEMLGVDREVKSADVKTKFFQLAKEWHPDRLPKELAALRPYCEVVFGYMSEAHAALENDEGRKQYVHTLREGGGTPASDHFMQRILDGAMEFERVLVLSRQYHYDEAIDLLERVLAASGEDPDHHAHHAWLLMKKFPEEDAPFERMLGAVNRAIKLSADHEKANLYKAQILQRMGKHKEARLFFKKVAEKNPRNVEAQREMRIASLRAEGGPRKKVEKAASGFLGKLFGKK